MRPRSHLLPFAAVLACLITGCASDPVVAVDETTSATGELQVVIWWDKTQAPVAARGKVTSLSNLATVAFDTRGREEEGRTLSLSPGRYSISVEHRYTSGTQSSGTNGATLQPVSGERVLYVEPGVRTAVTVIVSDREGDIGCVRSPSQRSASQRSASQRSASQRSASQRSPARPLASGPGTSKETALPLPLEPSSG